MRVASTAQPIAAGTAVWQGTNYVGTALGNWFDNTSLALYEWFTDEFYWWQR